MPIRAVTLDLDDTLWPVLPALEQADRAVDDYLRAHWPDVARAWPIAAMRFATRRGEEGLKRSLRIAKALRGALLRCGKA